MGIDELPVVVGDELGLALQQPPLELFGVVVGTFTYCLMVLRAVRGPLEDSGSAPVVPSLSIALAVVLRPQLADRHAPRGARGPALACGRTVAVPGAHVRSVRSCTAACAGTVTHAIWQVVMQSPAPAAASISVVVSSAAMIPVLAPSSAAMLVSVMRSSTDMARTAAPPYSTTM